MHQELLSLWGGKKKEKNKNQPPDAGSGWRENQTGSKERMGACPGKEPVTDDSLRREVVCEMGLATCAGTCSSTASPILRQPGCRTRRQARCLSHHHCQGSGSMSAAYERPKRDFWLGRRRWEGLQHQLMSSSCFLKQAWFPHFSHTLPLSKQAVVRHFHSAS